MEKEINMNIMKIVPYDKEKVEINPITKDTRLISIIEASTESFDDTTKKVFQWYWNDKETQ